MNASNLTYIIDDDRDVRSSIAFMLAAEGRASRCFASGVEFLKAAPDMEPGCVLLDVRMPGVSGLDVLRMMSTRDLNWPVVVMTGHGEQEIAAQAIMLGASDFVEKPFAEDLLLNCLDRACDQLKAGTDSL